MSIQIQGSSTAQRHPFSLPLMPRITGKMAAFGGWGYDRLPPSIRLPLFTGLKYVLPIALVVLPPVQLFYAVKVTYVALTALTIFVGCLVVRFTLKRGSLDEVNARLLEWSSAGRLEDVVFAVTAGAPVDFRRDNIFALIIREFRLLEEIEQGHVERAPELAAAQEAVAAGHRTVGRTALMLAARRGHTETVEGLIVLGAAVDAGDQENDETALMGAAEGGHTETVERLIALRADVNARSSSDWTALMSAADAGHTETVERLIVLGAAVDAVDDNGMTALSCAAAWGRTETVDRMIALGVDVNAQDGMGMTALMHATERGHNATVERLIALGAATDARTPVGVTDS